MSDGTLPLLDAAPEGTNTGGGRELAKRRGRPPGAKNKRSADLARYIEATYDGMTPGQQAAAIGMATRADLRTAKRLQRQARAEEATPPVFGVDRAGFLALPHLPLHIAALVVKAAGLAQALRIERAAAWALMARERVELLPYVHQKLPIALEAKGAPLAQVFVIPGGGSAGAPVVDLGEGEWSDAAPLAFPEENQGPPLDLPGEVSPPKSHG